MNVYEVIGRVWVVFSTALCTVGLLYFAYLALDQTKRRIVRGEVEEQLDLKRAVETRFMVVR